MAKKIGWAIIGCGGAIASVHARAVQAVPAARLVATCDLVPERAQQLAADYKASHWYSDLEEMLKREDIDVVSICTPSGTHGVIAEAAARAQKHVFVEKPLEITKKAIDRMIGVCREEGVKLGCVFQRRTFPANIQARAAIQEGRLGKMVLADAYIKYHRGPEYYESAGWRATWAMDGGGALMNQGVHGVDLLLWMVGDVKSVYAQADHLVRDIEVEDTAVAIVEFENGAFGVIEGTTATNPGQCPRFDLHGRDGSIVLLDSDVAVWEVPDVEKPSSAQKVQSGRGFADASAVAAEGHTILVADMCEAIKEDRDPYITGESARKAVDLILAIYESARHDRRVYL